MTGTPDTCTSPCEEEPGANDDDTKMKRDEVIKNDEVT